ncbi:phenylacetate--CoA ligase family protein [Amycolatopsis sp. NPDC051128]|uniref:phenylacetate--CoA ligase family protein n=1 Tax=Amycolatopsis sp. NPDC051128 TaxID=3155412 RepID=UPI00341AE153
MEVPTVADTQPTVLEPTVAPGEQRRYLEPDLETMPRAELEEIQQRRLLELVPEAYERSAFYRELWSAAGVDPGEVRSLADFRRLVPTFTKKDVQAYRDRTGDPFGGMLLTPTAELTSIMSTSGTTSDPELIPEIWDAYPPLQLCSARDLWEIGLRPGDKVLVSAGSFRGFYDTFYHGMGLVPIFVDTWIGKGEEIVQALLRFRPAYLQLMMPTVLELERLESTYDIRDALSSLKGASFAGQPLGRALAAKVRDDWGVEMFTYSSAGDTGTCWECREHDGYHLWEDLVLAESLDPADDVATAEGTVGELVATDLDNRAAPLIRYRSGDLVRLSRQRCGCGRTHARQWVVGRCGEETTVAGTPVVLGEVWAAVESLPETQDGMFQIIRESATVDRLRLRVGYEPARTADVAELSARLRLAVLDRVGVEPDLDLVTVDDLLTRSSSVAKFPRVVRA